MSPALPRQQIRQCSHCGEEFTHIVRPGRPNTFCSTACRTASRASSAEPPDVTQYAEDLSATAEDLNLAVTTLLATVQDDGDSNTLMRQITDIDRLRKDVEAAIVARARARGDSWKDICRSSGRGPERLRKTWTQDAVTRRLELVRAARASRPAPPAPDPAGGPAARTAGRTGTGADAETVRPPSQTPAQQLAAAMSYLQRSTRKSIKETALDMGVSPSHVSRILAGTRRPSWPVVERFAAVCRGSLPELRDLWEAAQRPLGYEAAAREPAPGDPAEAKERFHTALNALYLAADRPDLWAVQRISGTGRKVAIGEITRTLTGGHVPDWETTARLVAALGGRPAELRPLWKAAAAPPPRRPDAPELPAAAFG
ncbi:helix-turn-helix domain-containing protein [Streptomyces sp. NPDC013953]|uniref:helix-turn-helix domain-containing protein n=1 Tax=Streptomyces sp. NPDC013953 TaxID=3364868 RepID=UPI0036FD1A4C